MHNRINRSDALPGTAPVRKTMAGLRCFVAVGLGGFAGELDGCGWVVRCVGRAPDGRAATDPVADRAADPAPPPGWWSPGPSELVGGPGSVGG
jgi:hypothetical protein